MYKKLLPYGIINGLVLMILVILPLEYIHQIQDFSTSEEIELAVMTLVSGIIIYLGLRKTRKNQSHKFNYSNRVMRGIFIVLISGLTYGIAWNTYALLSPEDPDRIYLEKIVEEMKSKGASEDDIQDTYNMADYIIDRPALRLIISMSEPMTNGVWLPFILAFLFKNNMKEEPEGNSVSLE